MGQRYDARFAPVTAERIARNQSVFRDANERIREAAEEHGAGTTPCRSSANAQPRAAGRCYG